MKDSLTPEEAWIASGRGKEKTTPAEYDNCVFCKNELETRFLNREGFCPSCLEGLAEGELE